jgi:hypothetical protein
MPHAARHHPGTSLGTPSPSPRLPAFPSTSPRVVLLLCIASCRKPSSSSPSGSGCAVLARRCVGRRAPVNPAPSSQSCGGRPCLQPPRIYSVPPCSFGLSATSQQYFSLRTNQPSPTNQQYFFSQNKPAPATSRKTCSDLLPLPLRHLACARGPATRC